MLSSIWRFPPERKNGHPAPFPLVLPARIVYSILEGKKGIVLDPYVGSGTTLVAAKLLDSDYIGIDISKEYVEEAEKRIKNYESERKILNAEIEKHIVQKTFKERKINGESTGKFRENVIDKKQPIQKTIF